MNETLKVGDVVEHVEHPGCSKPESIGSIGVVIEEYDNHVKVNWMVCVGEGPTKGLMAPHTLRKL